MRHALDQRLFSRCLLLLFVVLFSLSAARSAAADAEGPATIPWQPGPTNVSLGHDVDLNLPEPYVFLGMPEASKLMEKLGNFHNENLLGLVGSKGENDDWLVTVRYDDEGFIKDDDEVKADELLDAIRKGTEEANKERVERGFKAIHVEGWAEPPRYEKSVHHLVWALNARGEGGTSVNYNTRVLGRRGFISINLITSPEHLATNKTVAASLLASTRFRAGARYEDFDKQKDKVAEYGLIGLVLGGAGLGAAKLVKVGLLAKFSKVIFAALIAAKKVIFVALAGLGAFVKRLFSRKEAAKPADE
jgi:uncharacterized membrane-anchored protein